MRRSNYLDFVLTNSAMIAEYRVPKMRALINCISMSTAITIPTGVSYILYVSRTYPLRMFGLMNR